MLSYHALDCESLALGKVGGFFFFLVFQNQPNYTVS